MNTPFFKYPTSKFGLGARAPEYKVETVGSLALYPQFCKSDHVLGLLNVNVFSDWVLCV